jgi:hypothetical protein
MTSIYPERVCFEFADRELEGTVVDTTTDAAYNQPPETLLVVDADTGRYTVPVRDTQPA